MVGPQRMRMLRDQPRLVVVTVGSRSNAAWQLRITLFPIRGVLFPDVSGSSHLCAESGL